MNQAAVRAALTGSVLVLDGVEKAERNVLPLLNNLLENREMALEDGTFLVAPERYDSLASTMSVERLSQAGAGCSLKRQSYSSPRSILKFRVLMRKFVHGNCFRTFFPGHDTVVSNAALRLLRKQSQRLLHRCPAAASLTWQEEASSWLS